MLPLSIQAQSLKPGEINYFGVDLFWGIMHDLTQDQDPGKAKWDALFETACYTYISKSTSRERLINRFEIAFMPSRVDEKKKYIANGGYNAMILQHLEKVRKNESLLKAYADSMKRTSMLESALELTKKYLPEGFIQQNPELYPSVSFGFFEPDGQASSKIIAIDLGFAQSIDFKAFLAHEAHHFFVGNVRRQFKETESDVSYVLQAIRQLHLEGMADLIDKKQILELPDDLKESDNWYAYHYRIHYKNAQETFSKIDQWLQGDLDETGKKIWQALHFGTHPEALHMALLIEDTFGKDHIIDIIPNPFDFFRSYQRAAKLHPDRGWVFSDAAMAKLELLEKEYLIE